MTIRFITAWERYPIDAIVTLAPSEETRLIGLGFATTDLDLEQLYIQSVNAITNSSGDVLSLVTKDGKPITLGGGTTSTQSPTKAQIEAGLNLALGDVVMVLPTGGGTLTIPIPTGVVASKEYKFTFQKQVADVWHLVFRGTPDISFDMIDGTDAVLKFSGNADATRLLMLGA